MELHFDFDKDKRTLTNSDGRIYGGQAFDNASTTLRFDLWHKDEFGNKVEWDPLEEGYYPYIMFLANNPRTKTPFIYSDSSSPVFDGYTFEVPYEITSLRHKSARVEFQLAFIKAGYEFNGSVAGMPTAVYLLSAPNGFALKPSLMQPMPDLPRNGPACMPMNPMTCEPSVVGWIEVWKDRGMMLPIEQTLLDQNGIPMPLTDLNAAAYARNGYELTFLSQRGKRQTVRLDVPILDVNGELSSTHLPSGVLTIDDTVLRLEGQSYDGKYNVLSLVHDGEVISRVDLPIEHIIESVKYDEDRKTIVIIFNTNRAGDAATETLEIPVGNMVTPYRAGEGIVFSQEGSGADKVYYVSIDQTAATARHTVTLDKAKKYADGLDAAVRVDFKAADAALSGRVGILEDKVTESTDGLRQSIEKEIDERKAADDLIRTDAKKANDRLDVLEPDVQSLHTEVDKKQAKLTAGTGIKFSGANGDVIYCDVDAITDPTLSGTSHKPVRNSVITAELAKREYRLTCNDGSVTIDRNEATGETEIIAAPRITVDTTFSGTSLNPASSAAIQKELDKKQDVLTAGDGVKVDELRNNKVSIDLEALVDNALSSTSENPVQNKAVTKAIKDLESRGRTIPNWAESGVEYMAGDVVQYEGALYISLADRNTKAPTSLETQPEGGTKPHLPYWSAAVHSDASVNAQVINHASYVGMFGNDTDTDYTIVHNLMCRELVWSIYTNDYEHLYIQATVSAPTINSFRIRLSEPPGVNGLVISIIRARPSVQTAASLTGPTVVEFNTPSTEWTYSGNDTAQPVFVQTIGRDDEDTITDIGGDIVQNEAFLFNPVTIGFDKAVSGCMVVAPATGCFDMDGSSLTIQKSAENGLAAGDWYLVQCFKDGSGESILDVVQYDDRIEVNTGGIDWQGMVCLYKATKMKDFTTDESTQVVSYQHNLGRYVGVQAYDLTDGLCGTDVDYDTLNKVSATVGKSRTGKLLVL